MEFIRKKIIPSAAIATVCVFMFASVAFAYYNSGETLNPGCEPTDSGCDVYSSVIFSSEVDGLLYATSTGVLSLSSDYILPATGTAENWNYAYNTIHKSSDDWQTATDEVLASSSDWQAATDEVLGNSDRWQNATEEVENNSATWNTAYSWGDHAEAGYLQSVFGSAAATGSLAIGGLTAAYPLEILSTVTVCGTNYGYLDSDGNVSSGGATGDVPVSLRTAGRAFIGGEIDVLSDMRLKNFVDDISPDVALKAVGDLVPLHFQWKSGGNVVAGFFAQDVGKIIPEAVTVVPTAQFSDQYMLNYNILTTYALAAIQELNKKINSLSAPAAVLIDDFEKLTVRGNFAVAGHVTFEADTVGETTLPAGELSATQDFDEPYEEKPIITITPQSFVAGSYWVENDGAVGFTIRVSEEQNDDVKFSWHAFAKKGQPILEVSDAPAAVEISAPTMAVDATDAAASDTIEYVGEN